MNFSIKFFHVAAVLALIAFVVPAHAADPIFAAGSRIGLVPPAGMVPSRAFQGFEDPDKNAAILITTLPAEAYDQLEKSMVPESLKKQGIDVEKREPVELSVGKGFLLTGKQVTDKAHFRKWLLVMSLPDLTALVSVQIPEQETAYPDKAVRAALMTLAVRAKVPDEERLSVLPFKVGDLAGFQINDVLPGRALLLIDAPDEPGADSFGRTLKSRFLIVALPGGPSETEERANFARASFGTIVGIKDIQLKMAEPLRIGGQSGFQIVAQAKDGKTDVDVMVVQWLRFGTGGFLQMVGVSRADLWPDTFTRMRTVRDSIDLK